MIRSNVQFGDWYRNWSSDNSALHPTLSAIADAGFVSTGGAHLLRKLAEPNPHIRPEDFTDLTGYECFVNSVHVEDFTEDDVGQQTFLLIERVFKDWQATGEHQILNALISSSAPGEVVLKFHLLRPGESLSAEPLDGYIDDAVAVIDSAGGSNVMQLIRSHFEQGAR